LRLILVVQAQPKRLISFVIPRLLVAVAQLLDTALRQVLTWRAPLDFPAVQAARDRSVALTVGVVVALAATQEPEELVVTLVEAVATMVLLEQAVPVVVALGMVAAVVWAY
jgi:hypothetical protein